MREDLKRRFGVLETWNKTLVNTMPYPVYVMLDGGYLKVPAAERPIRLREEVRFTGIAGYIPLYAREFFLEGDLPPEDEKEEILYIVSDTVARLLRGRRRDLIVPYDVMLDPNGNIISCKGFAFVD